MKLVPTETTDYHLSPSHLLLFTLLFFEGGGGGRGNLTGVLIGGRDDN